MIPYGRQNIGEDEISAVAEVLRGDWLTCGPKVSEFETALAEYCGAKHAIAVSNGTAALHVAMLAASVGPGMRSLTSTNTFLSSANAAEFVGGVADFADIDPVTRCVSLDTLQSAWREDVKAVVPVDFAGYPCIDERTAAWVHDRGAVVIEDASHALGSTVAGYKVGGLPWVDMTTFSFHPVKTIATGEGGAILTNSDQLAERCRLARNHGMQRSDTLNEAHGPWYYEMTELGYNYRITDIQCALGIVQLGKVDAFVQRRQDIVDRYNNAFKSSCVIQTPECCSGSWPHASAVSPAWHLYVAELDFDEIGLSRSEVMAQLLARGVGTQVHYIPVHLQPYYKNRYGYSDGKCPAAESYYAKALSLPLFPAMTDEDVSQVIQSVLEVVARA
jgi:perosamine synthetase